MFSTLQIKPEEVKAVLLSFAFIFTLMAAYYILRPVRDAMSSQWTDAELSTLYTMTFVASLVAVSVYGALVSHVRVTIFVPAVYGFFAVSFVAFYIASAYSGNTAITDKVFFVWISVFSLFHVSVFWSFMADIFSKTQAPRLFGFIAAGSSAGAIIGPGIALTLVSVVGREKLILISAAMMVIPIIIVAILEKLQYTELHNLDKGLADSFRQSMGSNPFSGFALFARDPYLLGIGLFILFYTVISTFIYFELKNLLSGTAEETRIAIWAGMDLAVNSLAILTALFGTGRLALKFGLKNTLSMVPIAITAGMLLVAAAPFLSVVICLQVIRRAGNYALTRPCREMLFTILNRERRFKAKSVIDVVVYRGGDMLAAWIFTGLTKGLGFGLGPVAAVGAFFALLWVVVARYLGRQYERSNAASVIDVTEIG
jgi:AAA family ATP:ADP antiporter